MQEVDTNEEVMMTSIGNIVISTLNRRASKNTLGGVGRIPEYFSYSPIRARFYS